MRNVLVTGGAGFIGSNFIHYVLGLEPDVRVINLDALTYAGNLAEPQDLPDPSRHTFIQGDICDQKLVHDCFTSMQLTRWCILLLKRTWTAPFLARRSLSSPISLGRLTCWKPRGKTGWWRRRQLGSRGCRSAFSSRFYR